MGLFGKLFEKKTCDLCGGEIGLLGNRKLEDGNCCKNCARKLSPFLTDRRHSTVEEIRRHLAWREQNRQKLETVNLTRVLGDETKVYFDDSQGLFWISDCADWREGNPDLIPVKDVLSCKLEEQEIREEIYRKDDQGKEESYSPPGISTSTVLISSCRSICPGLIKYPSP